MLHHFRRVAGFCLAWFLPLAGAGAEAGSWEILSGCRLAPADANDGDSFLVRHGDGTSLFRLYFVDAPEHHGSHSDRLRDQARYFAVPDAAVLATGRQASAFTEDFLGGEFTVITRWADARSESAQTQYFAVVHKQGRFLSHALVHSGLARVYGVPPQDSWPAGPTPEAYLKALKQTERTAQRSRAGIWKVGSGSAQLEGLTHIGAASVDSTITGAGSASGARAPVSGSGLINLNTASSAELQTLPKIGPAYAQRIIDARPFEQVDELTKISGITSATVDAFRHRVIVEAPPPPPFSIAFYLEDEDRYLNSEITVHVTSVTTSAAPAPDGFRSVYLRTATNGSRADGLTTFIPEEFYDSFLQHYSAPGREFTGLLYQLNGDTVLVYRRK